MLSDSVSSPVGRRTTEQIVERLLRKLQRVDSPDKLAAALALSWHGPFEYPGRRQTKRSPWRGMYFGAHGADPDARRYGLRLTLG